MRRASVGLLALTKPRELQAIAAALEAGEAVAADVPARAILGVTGRTPA